jgi:hypothetical protein
MDMNSFNPFDYAEGAKVLGIAMMVLGAGLLIFMGILPSRKKKPECDCDN